MRPGPRVTVFHVFERPDRKKPYTVRWSFNGKGHDSPSFAFKKEADRWRARLVLAVEDGTKWNPATGLPRNWEDADAVNVAEWCRRFLHRDWELASPNGRLSSAITLAYFVERTAEAKAPKWTIEMRSDFKTWLSKMDNELTPALQAWVDKWSPALADLDGPLLYEVEKRMRQRVDGSGLLGSWASKRNTNTARQCLDEAVRAHLLTENAWPEKDKNKVKTKSEKAATRKPVNIVITVVDAKKILAEQKSHQPASLMYRCMSCITFFAGLRPSEVVVLELADVDLPETGWGVIRVTKAWTGAGELWGARREDVGLTKTAEPRDVPLSPYVVGELRGYIARFDITEGLLFRTRGGERPTSSNWCRSLARASAKAGVRVQVPYDGRHFAATHLTNSRVRLARAAEILGHDKETLVRFYLHNVDGDEEATQDAMGEAFGE